MKNESKNYFISGIFNYCDRWCERCYMTARCRLFFDENEFREKTRKKLNTDDENEIFWDMIKENFKNAMEIISDIAEEFDIDLNELTEEDSEEDERKEKRERIKDLPLVKAAKEYGMSSHAWISDFEESYWKKSDGIVVDNKTEEELLRIREALDIISWYQFQIQVKLSRAYSSKEGRIEEPPEGYPKDSDGSAKVALIGIHRSIGAWEEMRKQMPEKHNEIFKFILHLDHLARFVQEAFPDAEICIRPGFDTMEA